MATGRQRLVVGQLRAVYQLGAIGDLSDRQLLERFTASDDEPAELAFAALVERHGPMVLRVCSALLRNPHDAQDAFQATFLVLLRKARAIWIHDSLGPWLHRVAKRLAVQVQASARRRRAFERRSAQSRSTLIAEAGGRDGGWTVLHEEIDRLPERYRVPVILCHLQGESHEWAAKALKLPVGTVKSRLHRARDILRGRLARRGAAFSAAIFSAERATSLTDAALVRALSPSSLGAAARSGMTQAAEIGLISLRTVHLVEEAVKTMIVTRMRIGVAVALLTGCLAVAAAGVFAQQSPGRETGQGPRPIPIDTARAGAAGRELAPAYIRQSRKLIVERLEQELALASERVDRTARKVRSETDPELVRARKTAETLAGLLARIDAVLVEAVDHFPTIFDFTTSDTVSNSRLRAAEESSKQPPGDAARPDVAKIQQADQQNDHERIETYRARMQGLGYFKPNDASAVPAYDKHSLAQAAEKLQWASRMFEKGYVSRTERDRYRALYEALKARIGTDILRAGERVDWARKMFEKGYLSKTQYDVEILKHYDALEARMEGQSQPVNDDLLKRYELLKSLQLDEQHANPIEKPETRDPAKPKPESAPGNEKANPAADSPRPF